MKEYGSNVQQLAEHLLTIPERETRTLHAHILIELMRQIHPNMRDGQEYSQKLWDDLYIMTKFTLEVDSPFPPPSEEAVGKKPQKVLYSQHLNLKYRQYGYNMIILVEKAIALEDKEEKLAFVSYLIRQMKTFYNVWNKDNPDDQVVFEQLAEISQGRLKEELTYLRQNGLVDSVPRDRGSNVDRFQRMQHTNKGRSMNNSNNNSNNNNSNNQNKDRNKNRNNNGNSNGNSNSNDRDRFRNNKQRKR